MRNRVRRIIFTIIGLILSATAYAQNVAVSSSHGGGSPSLGGVAGNLNQATDLFGSVLENMFYVIGIGLVTASIMQYREFRNNPSQTPLRRPIILFLCGLAVGFFPVMMNYIGNASAGYNV